MMDLLLGPKTGIIIVSNSGTFWVRQRPFSFENNYDNREEHVNEDNEQIIHYYYSILSAEGRSSDSTVTICTKKQSRVITYNYLVRVCLGD